MVTSMKCIRSILSDLEPKSKIYNFKSHSKKILFAHNLGPSRQITPNFIMCPSEPSRKSVQNFRTLALVEVHFLKFHAAADDAAAAAAAAASPQQ